MGNLSLGIQEVPSHAFVQAGSYTEGDLIEMWARRRQTTPWEGADEAQYLLLHDMSTIEQTYGPMPKEPTARAAILKQAYTDNP